MNHVRLYQNNFFFITYILNVRFNTKSIHKLKNLIVTTNIT